MISHSQERRETVSIPSKRRQIIGVFFLSLMISAGFWFINALKEVYFQDRTVHIKFTGVPEDKWLGVYPGATFDINIAGEGFNLIQTQPSVDTLTMNLSDIGFKESSGVQRETLRSSDLSRLLQERFGKGISIQKISIDSLTLELEPIAKRTSYVSSKIRFDLREGYTLVNEPLLSSTQATLYGPASRIGQWDTLYTAQEELGLIENSAKYELNISAPRGWRVEPDHITLEINVEEMVQGEVEVPITSQGKRGIRLIPDKVKVKYGCGLSRLDDIDKGDFKAEVDVEKSTGNRLFVKVSSHQPYLKLISYYPTSVDYLIIE